MDDPKISGFKNLKDEERFRNTGTAITEKCGQIWDLNIQLPLDTKLNYNNTFSLLIHIK